MGLSSLVKEVKDFVKKVDPVGSAIHDAFAKVPGSHQALEEALYLGAIGEASWNPYGDGVSVGDIWGGGTEKAYDPEAREVGRTIGTALGAYFGGSALSSALGSGGAGYTGTASELAADGLGGVDMWGAPGTVEGAAGAGSSAAMDSVINDVMAQPWTGADQVAVNSAGGSSFVDPTTGLTYDAGGLGSGTSNTSWYSQAGDWLKNSKNSSAVLNLAKALTQAQTMGGAASTYTPTGDSAPSGYGQVSPSNNSQGMALENPQSTLIPLVESSKPSNDSVLGLIDISPANNAFSMAGSTWNEKLANALRNRNAY